MEKKAKTIKPKELSGELVGRRGAICLSCGAIFENIKGIWKPCPECKAISPGGLRWITEERSWGTTIYYGRPAKAEGK